MSIQSMFKAGEAAIAGEVVKLMADAKAIPTELDKAAAAILSDVKPFSEHAAVAALQDAAKLRIAAADELAKAQTEAYNFLLTEKTRVLSNASDLKSKVEALLETLAQDATTAVVSDVASAVTKAA
jgi:vacuolar-type H+-ATPase subunit D/Vma8